MTGTHCRLFMQPRITEYYHCKHSCHDSAWSVALVEFIFIVSFNYGQVVVK